MLQCNQIFSENWNWFPVTGKCETDVQFTLWTFCILLPWGPFVLSPWKFSLQVIKTVDQDCNKMLIRLIFNWEIKITTAYLEN